MSGNLAAVGKMSENWENQEKISCEKKTSIAYFKFWSISEFARLMWNPEPMLTL